MPLFWDERLGEIFPLLCNHNMSHEMDSYVERPHRLLIKKLQTRNSIILVNLKIALESVA
jgi:hypothetical protein